MKVFPKLSVLALAALPVAGWSMGSEADIAKIVEIGKNRNQVMKTLKELTDMGPRLTGSPGYDRAAVWAMKRFQSYGLKAHLEEWGEVPVGFERGKRQIGRMVEPFDRPITFTTMNWTPGTNGLVRANAVLAPKTVEELQNDPGKYRGRWLIMPGGAGMRGQRDTSPQELKDALDKLGIAGRIFGTPDDRVHSSGTWRDKTYENRPKNLDIIVNKEAYDRIVRNCEYGRNVVLEFDIENRWIKGPLKQVNVIADLVGTEKPDEMVIVSGHLDSWDGPGAEGACDNGTGTMVAVETARILMKAGAKPKRTIRFIMWTGEEQGLHGSRRYVEMHKNELAKITCVFVDDGGTNYQGGVTCTAEMEPMLKAALEPAMKAFPDLPMQIRIAERIPAGGGSDHAPFNAAGVPGFFWFETGRSDYNYVHHTQHDKFEMAIPEYLVQSSTNSAAASYIMACAPTLLPRPAAPATAPARANGAGGPPPKR